MHTLRWVVIICCFAQALQAQTRYVPSLEYDTIQSAIDASVNGDTIIVSPGTYFENIDFKGKALTVKSTDPNDPNIIATTIIDGSSPNDPNFGSVVLFRNGEDKNSVLTGFTITGGTGSWLPVAWSLHQVYWNRCGGGVLCYNMAEPTIIKNVFINNLAGQGGAIYVYGDPVNPSNPSNPPIHVKPLIVDNTFINNTAVIAHGFTPPDTNYPVYDDGDGGAIVGFQGVDANIIGNLVVGNHAQYYGGGIHLRQWSNGLIAENEIVDNNSALGAGIHITYTSSPTVRDNYISGNIAGALGGGGIYVYYLSEPLIERNTIINNTSLNGAGIGVYYTSAGTIRNNLIYKNKIGYGIQIVASNPSIKSNTITNNEGGGINCKSSSTTYEICNNIISNNGQGWGIWVESNPNPTIRYNNIWNNGAGTTGPAIPDQTGINGNISINPNFVDADINDYHLAYSSPCINAGDPNLTPVPDETDFDGDQRILNKYIDMGADEVRPVYNLTTGNQYQSIQQAIDDANDFDVIVLTAGTYTGFGNRDINFKGKAITVQSSDPDNWATVAATIIDCQGSTPDAHRAFSFQSGEDANSILSGLTITGAGGSLWGAVYCYGSGPTIKNCIITNNSMKDHGSGIYCGYGSDAIITNCIISFNTFTTVGYGAGIYCYTSSPIITNCIITNNSAGAPSRHGGGICCWGADQSSGSNALVVNCIVAGNSAGHRGGGLYAYWSSPIFVNCTVIGNKALEGGGISSFRESNPYVINCIVRDNISPEGNQLALINTLRIWGFNIPTEMTVMYSNIEGGQSQVFIDPDCTLNWGAGNIDIDPNFVDPGYWDINDPGDPNDDFFVTGNYHLLPISGCIGLGDNTSIPPESTSDIDGEQRIFNDVVDIGADEVVTNSFDLDTDGSVDYYELDFLADEWLLVGLQTDFNTDGIVDFTDFALFAQQWLWTAAWLE